jgi:Family of unknown function (DUF5681)
LDFHRELLREFGSSITINENGRRRRISKYEAVIKQLAIKAISGNLPAIRILLALCQRASEKDALLRTSQSGDPQKVAYDDMTNEELLKIINARPKDKE